MTCVPSVRGLRRDVKILWGTRSSCKGLAYTIGATARPNLFWGSGVLTLEFPRRETAQVLPKQPEPLPQSLGFEEYTPVRR